MTIKYFTVENSGFTNGQTYFSHPSDTRYDSLREALEVVAASKNEWTDPTVFYRVVEHTYVRVTDKEGREKSSSHFRIFHYVD
jgi:hypothetical protein